MRRRSAFALGVVCGIGGVFGAVAYALHKMGEAIDEAMPQIGQTEADDDGGSRLSVIRSTA